MVTAERSFANVGGAIDEEGYAFKGLSTDEKPTGTYLGKKIANGSTFYEMDTLEVNSYDAENETWV